MKTFFLFFLTASVLAFAADDNKSKLDFVLKKYSEVRDKIYQLEYNIERIDTFQQGGIDTIKGYALIKKVIEDKNFGYYFAGECFNENLEDFAGHQNIYDGINNFDIDKKKKTYSLVKSVRGYPGDRIVNRIAELIFTPDNKHSNVIISGETNESYTIEYQFKDEQSYTDFKKTVILNKKTFLPVQYKISGVYIKTRYSHQFTLSNLKINEAVSNTIDKIKLELSSYSLIKEENEEKEKLSLVNQKAPEFLLPKLFAPDSLSGLYNNKITLVDFWEVWCGHCVESMPKVEALIKKFPGKIDIIGIVCDDSSNAKKLIRKLGVTFNSFLGNKYVLDQFGVDSYPRYFLVDKDGIIRKEYHGFSDEIENDIRNILGKK